MNKETVEVDFDQRPEIEKHLCQNGTKKSQLLANI
jgi:hypothetical protein